MRQLYDGLRAAILNGALAPGFRLPSSRDLARQLKDIAQHGIVRCRSVGDGRLSSTSPGDGVRASLRRHKTGLVERRGPVGRSASRPCCWLVELGDAAAQGRLAVRGRGRAASVFSGAGRNARAFPHDVWARCLRRAARQPPPRCSPGVAHLNRASLQEALLRHLVAAPGRPRRGAPGHHHRHRRRRRSS